MKKQVTRHRRAPAGKEKNGQQRFKCKSCKKSQQAVYQYNAYVKSLNNHIIALTKEGASRY